MLEKCVQTLEKEKQKAIDKAKQVCKDDEVLGLAVKEIEVNYQTVRNWLRIMNERGFSVMEDLSEDKNSYTRYSADEYRRDFGYIVYHFTNIKNIPLDIEAGKFKPKFASWF